MIIAVYFLPLRVFHPRRRSFVNSFACLHIPSSKATTIHPSHGRHREEEEQEEARF